MMVKLKEQGHRVLIYTHFQCMLDILDNYYNYKVLTVNMICSPRKKRRRVESVADTVASCKRCNCKKSKCLKLYCECFAAGVYCVEPCSCQDCFNKPIHEDTVLATRKQIESRSPLAFAPKAIKTSDPLQEDESSNTPASARHKRGCNCKKYGCLKKYCECYQGGVGSSINCRCEGCKNTFGRKDGVSEMDPEVNECEANASDGSLQTVLYNETELVSATPATPSRFGRWHVRTRGYISCFRCIWHSFISFREK